MLDTQDKCVKWQQERGLDKLEFVMEEAIYRYMEEIYELRGFSSVDSKNLARDTSLQIERQAINYKVQYPKDDVIVDAICDLDVFGCGDLLKLNYDPKACKAETIKEISSRQGAWSAEKGKWIKDPDQAKDTLYTADYSKCKLTDQREK